MKVTVLEYENEDDDGKDGRSKPVCEYTLAVSNTTSAPTMSYRLTRRHNDGDIFRSPVKVLRTLFLPVGYPMTVGPAYLPYQLYVFHICMDPASTRSFFFSQYPVNKTLLSRSDGMAYKGCAHICVALCLPLQSLKLLELAMRRRPHYQLL